MAAARARLLHGHRGVTSGDHWCRSVDPIDAGVLDRARAPVLDVGCGPGRHVVALAQRSMVVLGIDLTPHAVGAARRSGAPVLERSVFARIPGQGRWRTVLLLDGNVGIGGDPPRLLARLGDVLAADGTVLVELDPPGRPDGPTHARLEVDGVAGPWFPWARVPADRLTGPAQDAGFAVSAEWSVAGRHFAELRRDPSRGGSEGPP
jgi:SAM-dependent methyltransferase